MEASDQAAELIAEFEGFRSTAYPDPATGAEPWTIGYGTTVYHDGVKVIEGDTISHEDAIFELKYHINEVVTRPLNAALKVDVTQEQFDALVSFVYNCGMGNFRSSTLLRKLNAGDADGAAAQFLVWNKAGGKVMAGLTRRRKAEMELFLA